MLWDERLTKLKVTLDNTALEAALPGATIWNAVAAWLTVNGSWDGVPSWARQWQRDCLGGDHHVYGLALDLPGKAYPAAGFVLRWPPPGGGHQLAQGEMATGGWANLPIGPSGYDPLTNPGTYSWEKVGPSAVLRGFGLPYSLPWLTETESAAQWVAARRSGVDAMGGIHVSFFLVVQEGIKPVAPVPPGPGVGEWQTWETKLGLLTIRHRSRRLT